MPVNTKIDDDLQKRYEKKKKEKKEAEQSSFSYTATEDILVMPKEGYTVCRVLDIPKQCDYSFIKCDDDKIKLFKFPPLETDPSFLLYKIINKVLNQKWKGQDSEGKAIIEVPMKEIEPDIYWMVYNNEDMILGEYGANGWGSWKKAKGKYQGTASNTSCYVNVINRREFEVIREEKDSNGEVIKNKTIYPKDWCVANKHSLILTKSPKSVGAPITISNLLMTNIFPNYGNFQGYDVAINRMGVDPYYQLFKAEECIQNQEIFPHVVKGALTDAEKDIEVYNLEDLTKVSTYSFIHQNLRGKIQQIDQALGTQYVKELEQFVDEENPTKPGTPTQETVQEAPKEEPEQDPPTENLEVKETPPVREVKKEAPSIGAKTVQDFLAEKTEGKVKYDDLNDNEKSMIKGVSEDGTALIFTTDDLVTCPYCSGSQPTTITSFCLYCGTKF